MTQLEYNYISAARHSLATDDTLSLAFRDTAERTIKYKSSADAPEILLPFDIDPYASLIYDIFSRRNDLSSIAVLKSGYACKMAAQRCEVSNRMAFEFFGGLIPVVPLESAADHFTDLHIRAALIDGLCAVAVSDKPDGAVEVALALEYTAKLSIIADSINKYD